MIVFFDTETTGLPKNWKAPITDLNNWPRLIQIAWLIYDYDGKQLSQKNYIIKPDGFVIPADATAIHGISTERAHAEGVSLKSVLSEFNDLMSAAEFLVAHNMSFDEKIIGAELIRESFSNILENKKKICTMEIATSYCKIPGKYGYKWPTLSELHTKLFTTSFNEAHNAAIDIKATAKCFWELKEKGVICLSDVTNNGQDDFDYINIQLNDFRSKIANLSYVRSLVNECKPILSRIKSQLGENDEDYIEISCVVARCSFENLAIFLAEEKIIFDFLVSPSDSAAFDVYTILSKRYGQNSTFTKENFIEILTIATSLSLKKTTIWGSGILSAVLCDGGGTNNAIAKNNFQIVINDCKNLMQSIGEFDMESETRARYSEIYTVIKNLQETIENLSLLDVSKKPEPNSGCYIATMAYGDYDHPQVLILRNFRDSILKKYFLGRLFINVYYNISPVIVKRFKNNQFIKRRTRDFLDSFIYNLLKR